MNVLVFILASLLLAIIILDVGIHNRASPLARGHAHDIETEFKCKLYTDGKGRSVCDVE